jgi:hypothetical protein
LLLAVIYCKFSPAQTAKPFYKTGIPQYIHNKHIIIVMDAKYLKTNVDEALTEALSSMAVSQPDDPIEYIGNYLLQWVARREKRELVNIF